MVAGDGILGKHVPLPTPKTQQKNPKPHNHHHHPVFEQKEKEVTASHPKASLVEVCPWPFYPLFSYWECSPGVSRVKVGWCISLRPINNILPHDRGKHSIFVRDAFMLRLCLWMISTTVTTRSTWIKTSFVLDLQTQPRLQKLKIKAWNTVTGISRFS